MPALYLLVFPKFIKKRICCLCQMGGNLRKVHIDIEGHNNCCQHCKSVYQNIHRAPGGVLVYNASVASLLIVGVRAQLELLAGFEGIETNSSGTRSQRFHTFCVPKIR